MNLENNNCVVNILDAPTCYFGFHPATKKHKAVFVWCRGRFQDFPVCEVLTVGEDNAWRIIYEILPHNIYENISQYANGSIYWLVECRWIMAFDVGREKFRVIPAPEFGESRFQMFSEVDGCLAVICPDREIINMWILHDLNKENWTQETIKLPSNEMENWWVTYFHSVAGTDQMILETYRDPGEYFGFRRDAKLAKFYLYDRKQKTFKKFEVGGVSFLTERSTTDCISTFVESLLPVQKKLQYSP
ncbi:putative F-box protein At1g47730 [Papaver somniferum]|uniref:putative F-box protein At1g47730 n=1 Tax=Papaver somniferum TaxID=3469 RepID=UPI000E6FB29D|nr:putative F-box protein At1g47730 [Papaver somniferum]